MEQKNTGRNERHVRNLTQMTSRSINSEQRLNQNTRRDMSTIDFLETTPREENLNDVIQEMQEEGYFTANFKKDE